MTDYKPLAATLANATDGSKGRKLIWVSAEEYAALRALVDEASMAAQLAQH